MNKEYKKDNPGVYIPPPLIYAVIFFISILIQKLIPISEYFLYSISTFVAGWVLIAVSLFFSLPALVRFVKTKNTLITIKPAESLQTSGIYSLTRNPMYLGLLLLYSGLALISGNWWTLIMIPVLVFIMTIYVIKKEEGYLERTFGQVYSDYKMKTRRWI